MSAGEPVPRAASPGIPPAASSPARNAAQVVRQDRIPHTSHRPNPSTPGHASESMPPRDEEEKMKGSESGSGEAVGLEGRYRPLGSPEMGWRSGSTTTESRATGSVAASSVGTPPSPSFSGSASTGGGSVGSVCRVASTSSLLAPGRKYLRVALLSGQSLLLALEAKERVGAVLAAVCAELGVEDSRLLGLSQLKDQEHFFLTPETRLNKIAPKNWRSQHGPGTDHAGEPLLCLHLRVQVFVDFVRLISCPVALETYYLELRERARALWTEAQDVSEERCWEVAGLALQADFGDRAALHSPSDDYARPSAYFPDWVVRLRGEAYVRRHAPDVHRDLDGLDRQEARVRFCREVSRSPCPLNLHLYRVRRAKSDRTDNALFVVATRGLMFLDVDRREGQALGEGRRELAHSFAWSQVAKLSFHKRRISVVSVEGEKVSYWSETDEKSRYLLALARVVHQRTMALQCHLRDACQLELSERRRGAFRESYIYSDAREMEALRETGKWPSQVLPPLPPSPLAPLGNAARVSVVSNASSGTTSGIVSDRGGLPTQPSDEEEEAPAPRFASQASLGIGSSRGGSTDLLAGTQQILIDSAPPPAPAKAAATIATQVSALMASSRASLAGVTTATQTESSQAAASPPPPEPTFVPAPPKAISEWTQTSPKPAHSATVLTVNGGTSTQDLPAAAPQPSPVRPPPSEKTVSLQNLSVRSPPDYAAAVAGLTGARREPGKRPTTLSSIDPAIIVAAVSGGRVGPATSEPGLSNQLAFAAAPEPPAGLPSYGDHQRKRVAEAAPPAPPAPPRPSGNGGRGGAAKAVSRTEAAGLNRVQSMPEHARPRQFQRGAGAEEGVPLGEPPAYPGPSGLSRSTNALHAESLGRLLPVPALYSACAVPDPTGRPSARLNFAALKDVLAEQEQNFPTIHNLLKWKDSEAPPSPRPNHHPHLNGFRFPDTERAESVGRGVLRPSQAVGLGPETPSYQGYEVSLNAVAGDMAEGARFNSTPNLSGTEMLLPPPPYPCRPPSYAASYAPAYARGVYPTPAQNLQTIAQSFHPTPLMR